MVKNTPLSAVIAHQEAISAAHQSAKDIEILIETKLAEISTAEHAIPNVDHLILARENLLADVSLGHASNDALSKFDAQNKEKIDSHHEQKAASKEISENANQAISGLNRKLGEARQEVENLHAKNDDLLEKLLMSEAEKCAELFVQAALVIKEQYLRISAIDVALRNSGIRQNGLYYTEPEITIPTFPLPQFKELIHPNWPGVFYSNQLHHLQDLHRKSHKSFIGELHDAGVTLI